MNDLYVTLLTRAAQAFVEGRADDHDAMMAAARVVRQAAPPAASPDAPAETAADPEDLI